MIAPDSTQTLGAIQSKASLSDLSPAAAKNSDNAASQSASVSVSSASSELTCCLVDGYIFRLFGIFFYPDPTPNVSEEILSQSFQAFHQRLLFRPPDSRFPRRSLLTFVNLPPVISPRALAPPHHLVLNASKRLRSQKPTCACKSR
jgi:hypothetical protein